MKIALVQQAVNDDLVGNRNRGLASLRTAAEAGAKLVLFPELSFTPFYPQFEATARSHLLAESVPGETVTAFAAASRTHGVVSVINLFERAGDATYDTSIVIDADGSVVGRARMLHITEYTCFHEQGYYAPGDTLAPVFDTAAGRIGVCICYDRHFPEYMRSLALQGADLVLIPQAGIAEEWPEGMYGAEIRVASFQNGFFCAMANRVGIENNMEFAGESLVTDPFGRIVAQAPGLVDHILFADVDLALCSESPARTLFLRHRRPDIYEKGAVSIRTPT
jgi:N-carbamoylputrescine amidase